VDTLVVDKTGALTEWKPRWVTADFLETVEESELLSPAATLERRSGYPPAA
jgi:cation transport ATPase